MKTTTYSFTALPKVSHTFAAGAAALFIASSLHAATIVTPVDVTSIGGTIHQSALINVYNNTGLSSNLDNGATVLLVNKGIL